MISYAPLWKTMDEKGATSYTLINKGEVASATYKRLKDGESVSTNTLDAICKLLNCKVQDIIEFVPDEPDVQNEPSGE
jgi:DNA-binding Xre family transcriptional regulator